jgi:TetR/AcrR family tetracycline transcriptional repressor
MYSLRCTANNNWPVYSMQVPNPSKFPRRPGERAGLTTDAVLAAARRLLHEQGPDGLSMRRIATELGVLPNALYSHVADKQALLDALVDQLLGEIKPPPGRTWQDRVMGLLRATRATLHTEPVLAMLYVQRAGRGPNAIRLAEHSMRIAADAGIPPVVAAEAFRVMIAYTVGFVAFELSRSASDSAARPLPVGTDLDGLAQSPSDADFNRGLEWLTNGLTSTLKQ